MAANWNGRWKIIAKGAVRLNRIQWIIKLHLLQYNDNIAIDLNRYRFGVSLVLTTYREYMLPCAYMDNWVYCCIFNVYLNE